VAICWGRQRVSQVWKEYFSFGQAKYSSSELQEYFSFGQAKYNAGICIYVKAEEKLIISAKH